MLKKKIENNKVSIKEIELSTYMHIYYKYVMI